MAIRWLLEAYLSLYEAGKNIKIVPMVVNYDRIFESYNLATEMISGQKLNYNIFSSMKEIYSTKENSLGDIYVKYLEPIDLERFLGGDIKRKLNQENFEVTAQRLTTYLMELQQHESPVTLNSLISSQLLLEKNPSVQMRDLL